MATTKTKPIAPFAARVLGMLLPLGPVHAKAMFGGYGLYLDGVIFGLIADDRLFFKVDDDSRATFAKAGGEPFTYQPASKQGGSKAVSLSYCAAPEAAMASAKRLLPWAERGLAAAKRAPRKKPASKRHP